MSVNRNVHGWPFFDSINVRVNGRMMPVTIAGAGSPILFIHGFPLDRRMWDAVVSLLAQSFLCVAPDLRGFGKSREERFSFSIADLAIDCRALLRVLQINQPVAVCGLSMGGYIAMEFVDRFTPDVVAVVLANTKAELDTEAARNARFASANGALRTGSPSVTLSMRERLVAPETLSNRPGTMTQLDTMLTETPASTIAWAQLAMLARVDFTSKISNWNVPALCVAGNRDVIVPTDTMSRMSNAIPGGKLDVISDAGHLTPMEQPEAFANAVREFLFAR